MAPFWLPKCLPLGTLLALKIDQKNDPKSDCLEGRSKVAPRAPKTLPRRPPDPPRTPQEDSWTPSGCPRGPPGPPRTTQNFFRSIWPNNLFRKNRKSRNRRKHVEKKRGRQRSSTVVTHIRPHKNREHFQNGQNPEGGGGGRAKRSSIRRPQRSTACCKSTRKSSVVKCPCILEDLEETFEESL